MIYLISFSIKESCVKVHLLKKLTEKKNNCIIVLFKIHNKVVSKKQKRCIKFDLFKMKSFIQIHGKI